MRDRKVSKPKLNSHAVEALVTMHCEPAARVDLGARAILVAQDLACYADGWKLTREGKQIARHLTGKW